MKTCITSCESRKTLIQTPKSDLNDKKYDNIIKKCDNCINKSREIMFKNKTTEKGMKAYNLVKREINKCNDLKDLYLV